MTHGDITPVVVSDMSQLSQTLTDTIPSQAITGSILTDSASTVGADGGHVLSLTVDGTSYIYDPSGGGSIVVTGTNHGTFDTVTDTLTVSTDNGSTIAVNMDTGGFVYTAPGAITADLSEVFNYSLFDSEGDTASSTMTFNVHNIDQPPQVDSDRVITSISGSDAAVAILDWALTANDSDPDGDTIAVTGTSTGGSAGHAATTTTFTDVGTDGGSFDYTGTANGQTDTGHVIVDRAQAGSTTLNGTGLGEILIGQTGDDTINGFEGNDILIGNGGTDNLLGGAGDDIIVFQGVGSTYDGGTGFDTLRIADSLSGTIDLRSSTFTDTQIENIDHLALDGRNNVTVRLDYQAVVDMEPGSNSLRITGDAGDTINLSEPIAGSGSDKWIKTASDATTDTYTYTPSNGANPVVTLVVDHQMTVT